MDGRKRQMVEWIFANNDAILNALIGQEDDNLRQKITGHSSLLLKFLCVCCGISFMPVNFF